MGVEGFARLISCPVNPLEADLRPAEQNSYEEEKGYCKKSATDTKSLYSVNVLFLQFSFGDTVRLWSSSVHTHYSLLITFQYCTETSRQQRQLLKYCTSNSSWQVKVVSCIVSKENLHDCVGLNCRPRFQRHFPVRKSKIMIPATHCHSSQAVRHPGTMGALQCGWVSR